jgi:DNA polymerase III gamma/tau subunit
MMEPLIVKYRPESFDEVIGHEDVVAALERRVMSDGCPHNYLFTGPAGTGKTTLARIVAAALDAEVLEVDAASQSSIDSVRELIELGQYRSMSGATRKMFIIDECHGLSRQAFDALLKTLEEPPEHLFFALCTTEAQRLKTTVVSRCYHVPLHPLPPPQIELLIDLVCEAEGWKPSGDIIQMVVSAATGQPRKALSILESCHDAKDRDEARRVIALVEESEPFLEIMRHLASGKRVWKFVQTELAKIGEEDFDSLATSAARYISNVMLKEQTDERARAMWGLLDALTFPSSTFDRRAAFMCAIGRMMWSQ